MKKYNFNDDFEMSYLRHEHIKKVGDLHDIDITKYRSLAELTARKVYDKISFQFNKVGFDVDDVISITLTYLVGYIGMYGFERNPQKLQKFIDKYLQDRGRVPTDKEIYKSERNIIITFLRQRLYHCATICGRKARNIIVGRDIKKAFAMTETTKKACDELILSNYKEHNYRKVTKKELLEAKEWSRFNGSGELFDKDGFPILEIVKVSEGISVNDYEDHYNNDSYTHCNSPEDIMEKMEDEIDLISKKREFEMMSILDKKKVLSKFISDNKNSNLMTNQVKCARNMIKTLKLAVE